MSQIGLSEFADRLNEIMPVVSREFFSKQVSDMFKDKITISQLFVLDFLYKQGQSRMSDLAHFMRVTTAAMTGIVDRLVRSGYVRRIFEPQDRRIIKAELTARGAELTRKITEHKKDMIIKVFGRISQDERTEYLKILTHIQEALAEEKDTPAP